MPTERFCMRCGKLLERPIPENADYIVADDMIVDEPREVLYAVTNNGRTKVDSYEQAEVLGDELIRVEASRELVSIQKTGLVCLDDYRPTDFVIWGVHKKLEGKTK